VLVVNLASHLSNLGCIC